VLETIVKGAGCVLAVVVYAVVSDEIKGAIEVFPTRDEAGEMLALVLDDEPDWRDVLRVERLRARQRVAELWGGTRGEMGHLRRWPKFLNPPHLPG
jgi:hypothetical protein